MRISRHRSSKRSKGWLALALISTSAVVYGVQPNAYANGLTFVNLYRTAFYENFDKAVLMSQSPSKGLTRQVLDECLDRSPIRIAEIQFAGGVYYETSVDEYRGTEVLYIWNCGFTA